MTKLDLQQREETERRIAACVNAFEGIPTDRIEGKDLGQILTGELRLHGAGPRADGGFGFEFSGGICQLLAEAYADQFRQSGAINYLELLFQHTEIGPLTITMQRVEGLTPAQKLAQADAERDALQQKVSALAAENLALADFDWIEFHESGPYEAKDVANHLPSTPATDAVINEWMAKGVEKLLEYFPPYYTARSDIEKFLINLRAQGASNEQD